MTDPLPATAPQNTFLSYQTLLMPRWLAGPRGQSWAASFGILKDLIAQGAVEATKARFCTVCPSDALKYKGNERGIARMPGELEPSHRFRIQNAWDTWGKAGTDLGIVEQLALLNLDVDIIRNNQWEWDANSGNVAYYWARFWVIVPEWPYDDDGTWNDPGAWGDGGAWDTDASWDTCNALKASIMKWKSSHAKCVSVLGVNGTIWDYPVGETWGAPGDWSDDDEVFAMEVP